MVSDHLDNLSFVLRTHSASQHYIRFLDEANEFGLDFIILKDLEKSFSADNHSHPGLIYAQILFVLSDTDLFVDVRTSSTID